MAFDSERGLPMIILNSGAQEAEHDFLAGQFDMEMAASRTSRTSRLRCAHAEQAYRYAIQLAQLEKAVSDCQCELPFMLDSGPTAPS